MITTRGKARLLAAAAATLGAVGATSLVAPSATAALLPAIYNVRLSTASQVATGANAVFTLTFTNANAPQSGDLLTSATASVPSGFTGISVPAGAVGSDGSAWTVSRSGAVVSLSTSLGMLPGAQVSVPVTASAPSLAGTYTWPTTARGTIGGTTQTGDYGLDGDPASVTIVPAGARTVSCASGTVCDTGYVGSETDTLGRVVTTGSGADVVNVYVGSRSPVLCAGVAPQGKPVTYTTQALTRTVQITMELDKAIVNAQSDNGAAHYVICYESKTPFTTASGTPAVASGGFYYGVLPSCSDRPAPCLVKLNKTGAGDMQAVFLGQTGDPGGMFGA